MKKLQQFHILKISSERIRESNGKLDLTYQQAIRNQEVVSVADSELVRLIHRLTDSQYSQQHLSDLLARKKAISKKRNGDKNRKIMAEILGEINDLLYLPQIISVYFSNKRHAGKMMGENGFEMNGIQYVPFMASSGMIRRNTMLFIDKSIHEQVRHILENGRDLDKKIVPVKYGVYYSLYSSSSHEVSFPRIAVVPDLKMKTIREVDFCKFPNSYDERQDPQIVTEEKEIETNAFDGQGLVSPKFAKRWSQELELDYVPSGFIVRASFLKGLCVTFDFHKLAKERNAQEITDIYGNKVRIKDIDAIISESQFKLWDSYLSTEDYVSKCESNGLGWGITRVTPKQDKDHAFSSYQFIQSLDIDDVSNICKPTKDWISSLGNSVENVLSYLLGEISFEDGWFDTLDPLLKSFIIENNILKDQYFIKYVDRSISKKKRDSCMGRLVFPANYQFLVSDPYAQTLHVLGLNVESLLEDGECFSGYWNRKSPDTDEIALVRSPIVHSSEVNRRRLKKDEKVSEWFKHLYSGIVVPPYGISLDMAILGGAD